MAEGGVETMKPVPDKATAARKKLVARIGAKRGGGTKKLVVSRHGVREGSMFPEEIASKSVGRESAENYGNATWQGNVPG
jgi:hypothetical protein